MLVRKQNYNIKSSQIGNKYFFNSLEEAQKEAAKRFELEQEEDEIRQKNTK